MTRTGGRERRSLLQCPEGDDIAYVRLVCTRKGKHKAKPVGFVSFADDRRGVVIHDRQQGTEKRNSPQAVEGSTGTLLDGQCPSCPGRYQVTTATLRGIIEDHSAPGCVADVDLSQDDEFGRVGRAIGHLARYRLR